jgi:hypothetical protein
MPRKDRVEYNEYMREYRERTQKIAENKKVLSTSFMEKVGNEINQKKKEEETKTE